MILRLSVPLAAAASLGAVLAFGLPAHAQDAPPFGRGETVTLTVTRTVQGRSHGHSAAYWRYRNTQHIRERNSSLRRETEIARRLTVANLNSRRARADYANDFGIAGNPFLCVHAGEGSWTAATGNGYYGGLQMNRSFQGTYGRVFLEAWGTADHWPPFIQIAVAETARLSGRGYGPWPQTAPACGLR